MPSAVKNSLVSTYVAKISNDHFTFQYTEMLDAFNPYSYSSIVGIKSNTRSQANCVTQCSRKASRLDSASPEDESNLSHFKLIQHGRNQKMPHWRVLGACQRFNLHSQNSFRW